MKKIYNLPSIGLFMMAIILFVACQKQEALMTFPDKTKPPPPVTPPPVDPPPLSEDRKNIQFLYNGAELNTSMIGRKYFGEVKQPSGSYASGFDLIIRLDDNSEESGFQQLLIRLPLNASGQLEKGIYAIKDNQVTESGNIEIRYSKGMFTEVFPDAVFSVDQAKYNFNLSLRIEDFNITDHSIAGVIDSFRIGLAADTSKHISIKNAGFNFFYDYLELSVNDQLTYEATTNEYSYWFPRVSGGEEKFLGLSGEKLYSLSETSPFKQGQLTFSLSFNELQETFIGETVLPVTPWATDVFILQSEEYLELDGKPVFGLLSAGNYQCKFTKSPKIDVAGGMEISFDNGKLLMDEYYDYVADPVWGVYYPQEFKEAPSYKVKCTFYQKRL
jgi:hypothetical protein